MFPKVLAVEEAASNNRVLGLDLIRAAAIGLVFIAHGFEQINPFVETNKYTHFAEVLGVELFFVLSGFLIGTILIRIFRKEEKFKFRTLKDFWIRRWFKTLPIYYLVLFLNFILTVLLFNKMEFDWRFLFFSQNVVSLHPDSFDEAWSLSVEEWFYLSFPLLLMVFISLSPIKKKETTLLRFLFSFLVPITFIQGFSIYVNPSLLWDNGIRRLAILWLDSILIGVFASCLYYHFPKFWDRNKHTIAVAGLLPMGVLAYFFVSDIIPNGFSGDGIVTKALFFPVMSLFFASLLPLANSINPKRRTYWMRFVTHLSIISYSVYLLHFSIIQTLQNYIYEPKTLYGALFLILVFWAITFIVSTIVYNYYEKPCTELKEKWKRKREKAVSF